MTEEEPLVPVPIPALCAILLNAEKTLGRPLTEDEVLAIRDAMPCITMHVLDRAALEEKRGYRDIDPENAWEEWLQLRPSLVDET